MVSFGGDKFELTHQGVGQIASWFNVGGIPWQWWDGDVATANVDGDVEPRRCEVVIAASSKLQ